ncbi:MAG: alanine--tRNA ligase [Candidatus Kapabacteria bacterium]|nr:alanine--tRNA ligase [Candidatus Kapabacteria bacterium]
MTSNEIRKSFMDFFESKQHKIVPSAPVIPHGDPTLLFTNAGMNQFKDVFLGSGSREYSRAADTQKCIRVSGKHNDLEEVGVDTYHHTFFEMLGNWSFGDYYKKEAISWAWELITKVWNLPTERIHATVYRTDDEAMEYWKEFLPSDRIHRFDEKDNFWEMGETGPCGPCSEIHFDRTSDLSGGKLVNAGSPEVIEIWNLVFIQFNRKTDGSLEELKSKHVDTGMGFERICAVIQGKNSNYDSDVFSPIINEISKLSGISYNGGLTDPDSIAMRVIADHVRTLSFAIADGAMPGNEGRSYVLRRILRRACRFARKLGMNDPVIYKLLPVLIDTMGYVFPELQNQFNTIERVIKAEEESFLATLERGLDKTDDIFTKLKNENKTAVDGADAFLLYDSFGFPLDLTELIARENGFSVDTEGFQENMAAQRARSRAARKNISQDVEIPIVETKTEFVGYENTLSEAEVIFIKDNMVVLDRTPFYAESGGQISDTGNLIINGISYEVIDVKKHGNAYLHICSTEVEPTIGVTALAKIDQQRRRAIMRNHSATHLFHEALRTVLGSHVQQAGSLVSPEYLRFDFNHFERVSEEKIAEIEKIVNAKIMDAINVETRILSIDEARKNSKIKMFFGDKYGEIVRAVVMDEKYSLELCGGTHVKNTSEIGFFKIISESSIAAGVRRVEAVSGFGIEKFIQGLHNKITEKNDHAGTLTDKIKQLEKEIAALKMQNLKSTMKTWISSAANIDDVKVIAAFAVFDSIETMRHSAEELRTMMGNSSIGLISCILNEKAQLVCVVSDDLLKRTNAGKLVGEAAKRLGGGGGGKPQLATAGGKDITKIDDLLKEFPQMVKLAIEH